MNFLQNYSNIIEQEINKLDLPLQPKNLYDPLRYFLKLGGKRIRPVLTFLAAEMFKANEKDTKYAALTIELFHNFTLIHDDIMDNAPLRRNQATVHEHWNSNIAILAGDVLFAKAYEILGHCNSSNLNDLFSVFSRTAREVCEGQQMDMDFENRKDVSEKEYIEMIRLKTSVLLGCALEMGAILGNANSEERNAIYHFGVHLGISFQIQDDILDLFGSPEKVGKQLGGDVISNKKTLLSISAKSRAGAYDYNALFELESERNHEIKVKSIKKIFESLSAREYCEEKMKAHFEKALEYLNRIPSHHSKQQLLQLANYLISREY
jgi:geranylgeranyl diphosphate synthase type II